MKDQLIKKAGTIAAVVATGLTIVLLWMIFPADVLTPITLLYASASISWAIAFLLAVPHT